MKKVLAVLVVLALVCGGVFASAFSARVHVAPVGFQVVRKDFNVCFEDGAGFYALAGDGTINYYLNDNIRVGGQLYGVAKLGKDIDRCFDLSAYATFGCKFALTEEVSIAADFGVGGEFSFFHNGKDYPHIAGTADVTMSHSFNKHIAAEFGIKTSATVVENETFVINLVPFLGAEYRF